MVLPDYEFDELFTVCCVWLAWLSSLCGSRACVPVGAHVCVHSGAHPYGGQRASLGVVP